MTLRRPSVPLLAATGLLLACGDGGGPTPPEEVASVVVTPSSATFEQVDETRQFTAQALTEDGDPVSDAVVSWMSTNTNVVTVDETTGLATAVGDGTARIVAEADGVQGDADVTVEILGLQVSSPVLGNGRLTLPYQGAVEARGGTGGYSFELVEGTLPDGLALGAGGGITGTPTQEGTTEFTVRVTDSSDEIASRQVSLTVCTAPGAFAPGESVALEPPPHGSCGVFLPAGSGHRYRVALIRANTNDDADDVETVTLALEANPGGAGAAGARATVPSAARPALQGERLRLPSARLERYREMAEATRLRHARLRLEEERMIRRIGAAGVLPDRRGGSGALRAAGAAQALPAKLRIDPTTPGTCSPAGTEVTGLKIAENDLLGIYQDSTQNASAGSRVTVAEAQALLDFYADHGRPVIDEYFGGVSDINGDGKVVVFISPAVSGNTAAFVWSGDFIETAQCPASNEMEILFLNQVIVADLDDPDRPAQGLETLVHEMKHVSSLYQRLLRSQAMGAAHFHPAWWEEGVAEVAGGAAARSAWAADGGPAVTAMLDEDHWREAVPSGEALTDDAQFGVLLRLLRTQEYLASQPNGLTVTPLGARDDHSVYGSGWLFGRWLGDGFGGAASAPLAESDFWAEMNDQDWPSGVPGIEQATGLAWSELLDRYVLAIMLHGTGEAPPPEAFTTYDLISSIELWCFAADNPPCNGMDAGPAGVFPWPVTTSPQGVPARSFASEEYEGPAGPGGVRLFEFVSDGTGAGTELHVDVQGPARMVVVRID